MKLGCSLGLGWGKVCCQPSEHQDLLSSLPAGWGPTTRPGLCWERPDPCGPLLARTPTGSARTSAARLGVQTAGLAALRAGGECAARPHPRGSPLRAHPVSPAVPYSAVTRGPSSHGPSPRTPLVPRGTPMSSRPRCPARGQCPAPSGPGGRCNALPPPSPTSSPSRTASAVFCGYLGKVELSR